MTKKTDIRFQIAVKICGSFFLPENFKKMRTFSEVKYPTKTRYFYDSLQEC